MKKALFILFIMSAFVACNSSSDNKSTESKESKPEVKVEDVTQNPDYQKGLELASKADCFTCHKIDEQLTGPPYREVANKYANEPDTIVTHLAHKVIEGGSGVWGQVPMTSHPTISQADAEAMVKYVLLLKK